MQTGGEFNLLARKLEETSYHTQPELTLLTFEERQEQIKIKKQHNKRVDSLMLVIGIFVMCLAYTFMQAQVTSTGSEINKLQTQIASMENENNRIQLEIQTATSPDAIAAYAAENFDMTLAKEGQIIYYNDEQVGSGAYTVASAMSVVETGMGEGSVNIVEDENKLLGIIGEIITDSKSEIASLVGMSNN